MSADSRFSFDLAGRGHFPTEKIYRIGHSLFGEVGTTAISSKIIRWMQAGQNKLEMPSFEEEEERDCEAVVLELAPDGIFIWDYGLLRYPVWSETEAKVSAENMAIGSGRLAALYCMRKKGMSPERAVKEACTIDVFSGEPVVTESLYPLKRATKNSRRK